MLGTVVEVRAPTPLAADQIRQWWSRCLSEGEADAHHTITLPTTDLPLTDPLAQKLTHEVNLRAVEGAAGAYVMLHAGAVSDDEGGTIGLIAESGVGKTTATVALCRSGWGYVTDETLAIGPDGSVMPLPKPLALVNGTTAKTIVSPDELGLGLAGHQLHLSRLVLLDRDPTRVGPPTIGDVPLLSGVEALVGHSSAVTRLRQPLQAMASHITRCGGLRRVTYREADELGRLMRDLVSDQPVDEHLWWPDPIGRPTQLPMLGADVQDAIGTPDGVLALCGGRPVRLSAAGVVIWGYAAAGCAMAATTAAAAALLVDSTSPSRVVRETVEVLRDVGALRHP